MGLPQCRPERHPRGGNRRSIHVGRNPGPAPHATLDRTTNCSGLVSSWHITTLRATCRTADRQYVPTLHEFLTDARTYQATALVEVTTALTATLRTKFLARFSWTATTGQVRITSFDPRTLSYVHAATTIPLGLLVSAYVPSTTVSATGATAVLVRYASITASRVAEWHRAGLIVHSWTPNTAALWAQQRSFGVDGIITDLAALYR